MTGTGLATGRMQSAAIAVTPYTAISDSGCDARIVAARGALGQRLVILGHHYQRDETGLARMLEVSS